MQYIRNFELTFRSRRNSVFYFLAETGEKLHRRTEWSEYFSKQAKNQFFCSRPRVTGLLNICTRLLYPIKPKTAAVYTEFWTDLSVPSKFRFLFSRWNKRKTPSQDRMGRVFFKTGRKSVFLLTSEGYRIIKHLYQAFVSHQSMRPASPIWIWVRQCGMFFHKPE